MSLEFTLVRRAISLAVIDGPDAGDNPDILQAQGSVLFEPVIKKGDSIQVQTRGGSETYALAPIECPINDGIISHRGQDGVKLPAGGEAANPSIIRWKATFSRMQAGGKSFKLAPVIFDAVPGGEIDLTMVAPVAGAPEGVVRGPRGTSLEIIIVDGSELVFTAVDDAGSFEIARIPLDDMVRAEAEAAADGVRDALAVDVAASQSARDAAEGHANRAATSESNAAASESAAKRSETNAGDYAAVATTAATEAVDAMERATDLAGGDFATRDYVNQKVSSVTLTGTGFPEGNVAAPAGAVYTDSAATNGAIRWIKTRGTGSTGWEVEWGDTGWRNITADLMNGWNTGSVHIRRVGRLVQFRAYLLDGRDATSGTFVQFPTGFGNRGSGWYLPLTQGDTLWVTGTRNAILTSGKFYFNGGYHTSSSVIVSDSWPTILPGTPA